MAEFYAPCSLVTTNGPGLGRSECLSREAEGETHDPRARLPKGNPLKMHPRRKACGKPGTCLCSHEFNPKADTSAPSTLFDSFPTSSCVLSSRSEEMEAVIHNAASLLCFCDSVAILVWSSDAPGNRFPHQRTPYLCSSRHFCPIHSRSHTHSGTDRGGCGKFQRHRYSEESTHQYLGEG